MATVANEQQYSQRQLYTIKTFGRQEMLSDQHMALHCGCMACGKTHALTEAFGIYCLQLQQFGYSGLNFMLLGRTQNAVKKNMCNVLAQLFGSDFKYDRSVCNDGITKDATLFGMNLHIVGMNDSTAESKIRGLSNITGILHDEAVLCTEDQFKLVLSRLRGGPDLPPGFVNNWYIGSTNPDSPEHFLLKEINAGTIKLIQWYASEVRWKGFKETFERNKRLYRRNRAFWDRYILGKWTGKDSLVYQSFKPSIHILKSTTTDIDLTAFDRVFFSCDYGSNHPTALLLNCYDGLTDSYIVAQEWKFTRTAPSEIVRNILIAMDMVRRTTGRQEIPIYVDPAAASLKDELILNGVAPLNALNKHSDGIGFIESLFADDRIYIMDTCENLIHELFTYSYKDNSDEVVKLVDDFVDALRYGAYTDHKKHPTY
jgi:PBSX family phage terminase large subunit